MTGLELASIALGMSEKKIEKYLEKEVEIDVDCDGDGYFLMEFDVNELDFSDVVDFFPTSILTSTQEFWISVCAEADSFGNLHFKDCERLFKLHGGDWIEWTLDQPYGTPIRNVGVLKAALGH